MEYIHPHFNYLYFLFSGFVAQDTDQGFTGHPDGVQNRCQSRCHINKDGKPNVAVAGQTEENQNCFDDKSKYRVFRGHLAHSGA